MTHERWKEFEEGTLDYIKSLSYNERLEAIRQVNDNWVDSIEVGFEVTSESYSNAQLSNIPPTSDNKEAA